MKGADYLQKRRLPANTLNIYSQTFEKGWSGMGIGKEEACYEILHKAAGFDGFFSTT